MKFRWQRQFGNYRCATLILGSIWQFEVIILFFIKLRVSWDFIGWKQHNMLAKHIIHSCHKTLNVIRHPISCTVVPLQYIFSTVRDGGIQLVSWKESRLPGVLPTPWNTGLKSMRQHFSRQTNSRNKANEGILNNVIY